VVSAARSLAVLRSQVQREKEWTAALRLQTCWRGYFVRRCFGPELERQRAAAKMAASEASECNTRGSESARSRGSRHTGQRSCKGVEQPASRSDMVEVGPILTVEEARQLAQRRVKNTRGGLASQRPSEQKASAAAGASSSVRRHTVSELLEQEAAYRASLPKLPSASQKPVAQQVSRPGSNEKRSKSSPPTSDLPGGNRPRGSSEKGQGRDDSSGGGAKRLPKAVTPRTTTSCAAPRGADAGANKLRTPRAPGAGAGIAEQGGGYAVSPRRSWG